MAEAGLDITSEKPRRWTDDVLGAVDVVVIRRCADARSYVSGKGITKTGRLTTRWTPARRGATPPRRDPRPSREVARRHLLHNGTARSIQLDRKE